MTFKQVVELSDKEIRDCLLEKAKSVIGEKCVGTASIELITEANGKIGGVGAIVTFTKG